MNLLARRWEHRAALTDGDRADILDLPFTRRTYARDAYLVREGEPPQTCALLVSGFAFRGKLIDNRLRQIISIHIPGEFVDLQNWLLDVADHNVQSMGRSEVAIIPKAALNELILSSPRINLAVWLDTLIDASIFREWVVNVGRRDAPARIAHLLCELMLRMRASGLCEPDRCVFPLTQEQVADATGLTPVHTNRTLQGLRRDGLIALSDGTLTVLDWQRLADAGDFSERYLHQSV